MPVGPMSWSVVFPTGCDDRKVWVRGPLALEWSGLRTWTRIVPPPRWTHGCELRGPGFPPSYGLVKLDRNDPGITSKPYQPPSSGRPKLTVFDGRHGNPGSKCEGASPPAWPWLYISTPQAGKVHISCSHSTCSLFYPFTIGPSPTCRNSSSCSLLRQSLL